MLLEVGYHLAKSLSPSAVVMRQLALHVCKTCSLNIFSLSSLKCPLFSLRDEESVDLK
jgi:hypothetical protein